MNQRDAMKTIVVLRGPPGDAAIERTQDAGVGVPGVGRLVVSVVDRALMTLASMEPPSHPVASILEVWGTASARAQVLSALDAGEVLGAWSIDEIVQKDDSDDRRLGHPSTGIKAMYFVRRLASLSPYAFRRHWEHVHGPLATRVHVGCSRYVQNHAVAAVGRSRWTVDGVSELYFPTKEDLLERFCVDAQGARDVARDVGSFVGETESYAANEHLLYDI